MKRNKYNGQHCSGMNELAEHLNEPSADYGDGKRKSLAHDPGRKAGGALGVPYGLL